MRKPRYTVQTFVDGRMACYTAYDGVIRRVAQTHFDAMRNAVLISYGTADIYWRENDVVTLIHHVSNGAWTAEQVPPPAAPDYRAAERLTSAATEREATK